MVAFVKVVSWFEIFEILKKKYVYYSEKSNLEEARRDLDDFME